MPDSSVYAGYGIDLIAGYSTGLIVLAAFPTDSSSITIEFNRRCPCMP
jgi:hypothetical protein